MICLPSRQHDAISFSSHVFFFFPLHANISSTCFPTVNKKRKEPPRAKSGLRQGQPPHIDSTPVTHAVPMAVECRLRHRFSAPSVSALTQNGWCCAFACPPRQHIDRLRSCGPVPDVAHKALATKVVIARLQDAPIERAAEVPSAVQVAVRTDVRLRGAYVRSGRRSGCGGRPPRSGRLNRCSRRRRWLSAAGPSSRPPRRSCIQAPSLGLWRESAVNARQWAPSQIRPSHECVA
jgi:hypothetical protein